GRGFTYSCHVVRGKGTRIKGFGGTASGPEELVKGINQICGVLDSRVGKHLRPIDALDVMNIIGSVVVAGNVRRSAQISLGHADDS
ncbi:ribonucleoside-triphosphate reductase, adenosylcobalamin-dependent, partial [Lacticaseibacillus paracasei]